MWGKCSLTPGLDTGVDCSSTTTLQHGPGSHSVWPDMTDHHQDLTEKTKLITTMGADKTVPVIFPKLKKESGLYNFWALTWLTSWYIFSGETVQLHTFSVTSSTTTDCRLHSVFQQIHPHISGGRPHPAGRDADGGHPDLWLHHDGLGG